jgi:hypothetical protein
MYSPSTSHVIDDPIYLLLSLLLLLTSPCLAIFSSPYIHTCFLLFHFHNVLSKARTYHSTSATTPTKGIDHKLTSAVLVGT